MKNVVYFDLETQHAFGDVGGRSADHLRRLKMSIAVTFSTQAGEYCIYHEGTAERLIQQLLKADLVVGHNVVAFDYHVLSAYTALDLRQIPTLDTLIALEKILKHRLSLDAIARATLGAAKSAGGLDAVRWWRDGGPENILKIAEYCCHDVKLTRLVHEFGRQHGQVHYRDRFGQKRTVHVQW